jgi:endoglycosylceramidase
MTFVTKDAGTMCCYRTPLRYVLMAALLVEASLAWSWTGLAEESLTLKALPIRDEFGRELILGGYVAITEDSKGVIRYSRDDYRRMVRMGANAQVIRVTLGRLGGWPNHPADPDYLDQIDEMVRFAKEAGLKTIFKLVVYDVHPFGPEQWDALYRNKDGTQDTVLKAWRTLWEKYKDEPSVFGYDLLNEPQRGLNMEEEDAANSFLLPTLRRFAEALREVSPHKWALFQPLMLSPENRKPGVDPFLSFAEPFGQDRIIFAPHLYHMDVAIMQRRLEKYLQEANLSHAPLLIGEWGPATPLATDSDPKLQERFTTVYRSTAAALDRYKIGAIKAWFCGSRSPLRRTGREPFTWAIFSDDTPTGQVERRYITDVLARPRPLVVAGTIQNYGFDFDERVFSLKLRCNSASRSTEIFVSADRHYPRGFRLKLNDDVIMTFAPDRSEPTSIQAEGEQAREQARFVRWDCDSLHLIVEKWVVPCAEVDLRISPVVP